MTPIEILEKIIENNGSCNWTHDEKCLATDICKMCPLSYDPNGKYISCCSAIIDKFSEVANLDDMFLKQAKDKLVDLLMEEMLLGLK